MGMTNINVLANQDRNLNVISDGFYSTLPEFPEQWTLSEYIEFRSNKLDAILAQSEHFLKISRAIDLGRYVPQIVLKDYEELEQYHANRNNIWKKQAAIKKYENSLYLDFIKKYSAKDIIKVLGKTHNFYIRIDSTKAYKVTLDNIVYHVSFPSRSQMIVYSTDHTSDFIYVDSFMKRFASFDLPFSLYGNFDIFSWAESKK